MLNPNPYSTIELVKGDITTLDVDAVVNAANTDLSDGGGVNRAIHEAAGPELNKACALIGHCPTGGAVMTDGYQLPARHIIHAVGPIYMGTGDEQEELFSCYIAALELAIDNGMHSIAFPAISTGNCGYPVREAADIAIAAIQSWLNIHDDYQIRVIFCCNLDEVYDVYDEMLRD